MGSDPKELLQKRYSRRETPIVISQVCQLVADIKKKHMRIFSLFMVLAIFMLSGCEKLGLGEQTPVRRIALSIDSTNLAPGDLVTIKLDAPVTGKTTTIMVRDLAAKGFASGDSAYSFLIPVVAAGNASVRLPGLKGSDTLQVTIRSVAPVVDPGKVLTDFALIRDRCMDSLMKQIPGADFTPSVQTQAMFKQLQDEWNYQISLLSAAEKELLAYHVRTRMADPAQFSFMPKPAGYYGQPQGMDDIGDELILQAKSYVFATVAAVASGWGLTISGTAFLLSPNPLTGVVFLAVLTTYVVMKELAARRAAEVGRLNGIPEAIAESNALQPAAIPEFQVGTERTLSLKIHLRNLKIGDQSLSPDLAKAFAEDANLEGVEQRIKSAYDSARAFLKHIKVGYAAYTGKIGRMPVGKLVMEVPGNEIIVKGLSLSNLQYQTRVAGTNRMIKITGSTFTNDVNFNILLAYKRKFDGKEFTASLSASFKVIRYAMSGMWRLIYFTNSSRSTMSQSDLIDFGAGSTTGYGLSYIAYPSGITHIFNPPRQWNQQFRPDTYKLNMTVPGLNILYQFDCDGSPGITRMIGQSIGASNNGYTLELVKQ